MAAQTKCPACRKAIEKRPRKLTPCPHCSVPIRLASDGKMYTEAGLAERAEKEAAKDAAEEQREWFRDARKDVVDDVKDCVRENKKFSKGGGTPVFGGYRIVICPACSGAADRNGAFVPIDVAAENPALLPPYEGLCKCDSCECTVEMVPHPPKVPKGTKGTKVLKVDGSSETPKAGSGCGAKVLLALVVAAAFVWRYVAG